MAIVKDTSLRVLGDVVRAGRTTAKRMGYVVDTGKYGKGYGWLWSESQRGAFVGIHGDFLAYSEKDKLWHEIPTLMVWGGFQLYSMADDRPLEDAMHRLPALAKQLEEDGGLLAETEEGPLYNLASVQADYETLIAFPGFHEAMMKLGISDKVDEAINEQDYIKQVANARYKLMPPATVNAQVWLAARHGIVNGGLVARYRLDYRKRLENFVTQCIYANTEGRELDAEFKPRGHSVWMNIKTEDARQELRDLVAQCVKAASMEWRVAVGDAHDLYVFAHPAKKPIAQVKDGWVAGWLPGCWVRASTYGAGFALSEKAEKCRAFGLLHPLASATDSFCLSLLGAAKVKVVEVECAGRKVRALVGALDVEPERFDELSRAEKKTASAAFAHAGVKASLVARLVEAL